MTAIDVAALATSSLRELAPTLRYLLLVVIASICRDYNELYKTKGEHPPTVSNLPFPLHVMTSAPFQATPLPDLHMDAFRAHL